VTKPNTTQNSRAASSGPWYVYVLRCRDGSLYVGFTCDVGARVARHEAGRGARYTRGRGPLVLLAVRACADHREAARLERAVKAAPRDRKLARLREGCMEPPYGGSMGRARECPPPRKGVPESARRPVRGCP
jgi:putative endonuclease